MELGLNLFWLLLIMASLVWRLKSRWPRHQSKTSRHSLVAMGCALTILFPVISLTDNLHGEQAVLEDSSSRVLKKCSAIGISSNQTKLLTSPACLAAPLCFSSCRPCVGRATSAVLTLLRPVVACVSDGRGPPRA
jgi:hypothetical protein